MYWREKELSDVADEYKHVGDAIELLQEKLEEVKSILNTHDEIFFARDLVIPLRDLAELIEREIEKMDFLLKLKR